MEGDQPKAAVSDDVPCATSSVSLPANVCGDQSSVTDDQRDEPESSVAVNANGPGTAEGDSDCVGRKPQKDLGAEDKQEEGVVIKAGKTSDDSKEANGSEGKEDEGVEVKTEKTSDDNKEADGSEGKEDEGVEGKTEKTSDDSKDVAMEADPRLYNYINNSEYTSEIFKIEINNLPKKIGFSQLKKRLVSLDVKPVKIKLITGGDYAFVTFRNEAGRENALRVLDGHVWKSRSWKVKKALPKADPLAKKRKLEGGGDNKVGGAEEDGDEPVCKLYKDEDESNLTIEERLQNAVTPLWNMPYEEQLKKKESNIHGFLRKFCTIISRNNPDMEKSLKKFRAENHLMCCLCDPIKASPVIDAYRNKCEFTIGQSPEGIDKTVGFRLGAYKGGQLNVVAPLFCKHIPEAMKKLITDAQTYLQDVSTLKGFDPKTRDGHWQVLTIRTTQNNQTLLIFTMHPQDLTPEDVAAEKKKMTEYFSTGPGKDVGITSLYFQLQSDRYLSRDPNASQVELLLGNPHIEEDLLGMKFRISHNAFFQVNTAAAEVLYSTIGEWCKISADSLVLDVCCGTGTIGLTLAKQCKKVIGIEMVQEAVDDAIHNAELNNITNAEFHCGKAEDVLPKIVRTLHLGFSEVVAVVDPPRGGLHPQVVKALRKATFIKRLLYVSCNVAGATHNLTDFTRAVSRRIKGPEFKVTRAIPVDLFPHSNHIELVLLLEREKEF